jgi:transposase
MQKLKVNNKDEIKKQIYQYFQKSDEARYIHRLHGILLLIDNEENNCASIGALFNNSPRSLSNWVHKINSKGKIEVLKDQTRPGRRPRLTAAHHEQIREVIQRHPEEAGISANIWDGKTLSHYIEKEFGMIIQVRQCQRLFKKLGFSLKRARPIVAKGDPEKKAMSKKTPRKNK